MNIKRISIPALALITLMLTVGCNTNKNIDTNVENTTDVVAEQGVNQEDVKVQEEKPDVEYITSNTMYKNYVYLVENMDTLTLSKACEYIKGSSANIIRSDIQRTPSDSGEQLLSQVIYNIKDNDMTLVISYDNTSSEATISIVELQIDDTMDFMVFNNTEKECYVNYKGNKVIELSETVKGNYKLEDNAVEIMKALVESEDLTIDKLKEKTGLPFVATGSITIDSSIDPAATEVIKATCYTINSEDSQLVITTIDGKVYTVSASPCIMFGEPTSIDSKVTYSYYNRRALEPKRVAALEPDYKPEFSIVKRVSNLDDQLRYQSFLDIN